MMKLLLDLSCPLQCRDICGTGSLAPMEAVMTVCNLEMFTCHSDGACIEMERRWP